MDHLNIEDIKRIPDELDGWGKLAPAAQFLVKKICTATGWPYGEIWIPEDENKQMKWYTCWSASPGSIEHFAKFSSICKFAKGIGMIGTAWEKNEVIILEDLKSDFNFLRLEPALNAGFTKGIAIPIRFKGEVFAVVTFFMRRITDTDRLLSENLVSRSEDIGNKLYPLLDK